jgi:hypothetical protein
VNPHTLILQRVSRQGPERAAIPLHDRGHQLGYNHRRIRREEIERCAQRETHSKTADKHARLLERPHPLAGERGQRLL